MAGVKPKTWAIISGCAFLTMVGGRVGFVFAGSGLNEPLANLWLTLQQLGGGDAKRFADSTGPFKDILA